MKYSIIALAVLSTATMSYATNLYTDSFNYPVGTALGANAPWQNIVARTPAMTVFSTPANFNYAGIPSAGNSVQLNNSIGDTNVISLGTPITSGTVYYSMVLQLNSSTGTGQPFLAGFDGKAVTDGTFDSAAALVITRNSDNTNNLNLGIASPGNNNATKKYSSTAYTTSDVLFVVGSYTFNTVEDNRDDVMNLYVYANGAAIPSSVASATPVATSSPAGTTGATSVDAASITRFYLRDNTGEPPTMLVDDVRVGTSWQDILPLAGDSNLDGKITADDYALIDRGYARYQSGAIAAGAAGWTDGDYNMDHVVDGSDYMLIDQALLNQGGTLSPSLLLEREAQFGEGYVAALTGAVPEPASLGVFGVIFYGLNARRRQRI